MKLIIDNTEKHSREQLEELKEFLSDNNFTFDEEEFGGKSELYSLTAEGIHVIGSHGVTLNEKICDEELHEYSIIERETIIDNLISWIGECGMSQNRASDKYLMQQDLEMLVKIDEKYLFSSNSTNSYIFNGDSGFDEICKELIELNNSL